MEESNWHIWLPTLAYMAWFYGWWWRPCWRGLLPLWSSSESFSCWAHEILSGSLTGSSPFLGAFDRYMSLLYRSLIIDLSAIPSMSFAFDPLWGASWWFLSTSFQRRKYIWRYRRSCERACRIFLLFGCFSLCFVCSSLTLWLLISVTASKQFR